MSNDTGLLGHVYHDATKNKSASLYTTISNRIKDVIRPECLERRKPTSRKPLRPTAYLDGLRGFAAMLVYWGHHQLWAHKSIKGHRVFENGFGFDRQFYFAAVPGIRTFFSGGHFAVSVFFVMSGYVLATKPLRLIQCGRRLELVDNLASSVFRRWMRLYIPVIVISFIFMTSWHAFGIWTLNTPHKGTYREELWSWYAEFKNFSFVLNMGGDPWFSYDMHTWSIATEMKGSLVVFTTLLSLSGFTRNARLWCQAALIFYLMYIADGALYAMFVAGMLLADIDLLASTNNLPRWLYRLEPVDEFIFNSMFFISIYLGGVPQAKAIADLRLSHGWYYLSYLKPQAAYDYKWFYLFIAAVFLVAAVPRMPWLKAFFETRFCQYLGRISFSFYLVHGPIMWTLGDRLYIAAGWYTEEHMPGGMAWMNLLPIPRVGPLGLEANFLLPHLIILPFTLWLAEVITKLCDEPSVKFPAWLYSKLLATTPGASARPASPREPLIDLSTNKIES